MLNKNSERPTDVGEIEVFNFNRENSLVRSRLINGEPWFLANDIAEILGYSNPRDAIRKHCNERGVAFCDTLTDGGIQKIKYINEGNMYRLIVNCKLPIAEIFEEWIFDEVLPSIRKKGYYGTRKETKDYLDVRDIPYKVVNFQDGEVRVVEVGGEKWYSLNDIHSCIGARTESSQSVRRLNAKQMLARKMWLYGVPNPGWFVKELGVRLLLCASQKIRGYTLPTLDFDGKEV